ncbi:MAG: helix-turn-helix domain-containing protein [Marinifilaceae bacterium]
MEYSELLNHFLLSGILLALCLILILSKKKHRNIPNLLFAILMVNLSLYCSLTLFNNIGWFDAYPFLFAIRVPVELLFAPFLYLYFMMLAKRKVDLSLKFFRHLYVLFLSILLLIPFLIHFATPLGQNELMDRYFKYYQLIGTEIVSLQFLLYSFAVFVRLKRHKFIQLAKEHPVWYAHFKHIRLISVLLIFHGLIRLLEVNLGLYHASFQGFFEIGNVLIYAAVSLIFTYSLISNPVVLHYDPSVLNPSIRKKKDGPTVEQQEGLVYMKKLNEHMAIAKPYLNPDLSIQELAEQVKIPSRIISDVVNNIIGQNFNDYVNNYRVEEYKKLSEDSSKDHYTVLALGYEAGFKSKTTFNTAFKKFTGNTPSEYRKAIKQK